MTLELTDEQAAGLETELRRRSSLDDCIQLRRGQTLPAVIPPPEGLSRALTELPYGSKLRPVLTAAGSTVRVPPKTSCRQGGTMSQTAQPGGEAMPTKPSQKKTSGGKPNALQKPLQPSEELAAVVGSGPLPRGQVVSKVWEYIRSHKLQNPENRREILADDKLRKVFGKDKTTMFEMNKHLAQHLR
jgi:hypothetical protein